MIPLLLIALISASGSGEVVEGFLAFADHLFEEGDYLRAAAEYERAFFLSSDPDLRDVAAYRAGLCYEMAGRVERALRLYGMVRGELASEAAYRSALTLYDAGRYREAISRLDRLEADPGVGDRASILKGVCLLRLGDPEGARAILLDLSRKGGDEELRSAASALAELAVKFKSIPRRSPLLASLLSVIPGLGKLYAGRGYDGLYALLTIGSGGFLAYRGFSRSGVRSAQGWIFGALTLAFYLGDIYGSKWAAREFNRRKEEEFWEEVESHLAPIRRDRVPFPSVPRAASKDLPFDPRSLGDRLFKIGDYEAAATEYERLLLSAESPMAAEAHRLAGLAWGRAGEWNRAAAHLREAVSLSGSPDVRTLRRIELALALRKAGDPEGAEIELLKAISEPTDPRLAVRARFDLGVLRLERRDFEGAWEAFQLALPALGWSGEEMSELQKLLERGRRVASRGSTRLAQMLSIALPGAGQIYAGDWKGGLNAALLNGLLAWWAYREWRRGKRFESIAIAVSLIPRYYLGSVLNARKAVERRREAEAGRIAVEAISFIRSRLASSPSPPPTAIPSRSSSKPPSPLWRDPHPRGSAPPPPRSGSPCIRPF